MEKIIIPTIISTIIVAILISFTAISFSKEEITPIKYEIIQKPMTITFEKGIKIITHPSGVISKYNKIDIQNFKDELVKEKENIEQQIKELDEDLIKIGLIK